MSERPLIITDDDQLLEDLLRLTAAAGVEPTCNRQPASRSQWRDATVILADGKAIAAAVATNCPRRAGVYAVLGAEPDARLWEQCVRLGVERTVVVADNEAFLVDLLTNSGRVKPVGGRAIAVVGARGGLGASVLAAVIGVTAARAGSPVILADCDPWSTGLETILGVEGQAGLKWPDLIAPNGLVAAEALHRALPSVADLRQTGKPRRDALIENRFGRLGVLGHDPDRLLPIDVSAVEMVVKSCRSAGEVVVLDTPRSPVDVVDRIWEIVDLVVLLVGADIGSCSAAKRSIERLQAAGPPVGLVVRGPAPGGLGADDVAQTLALPLIAAMRPQPNLARELEFGYPPGYKGNGPLVLAARKVLTWAEMTTTAAGAAATAGQR